MFLQKVITQNKNVWIINKYAKYYGSQTSGANKIVRGSMVIRSAGETTVNLLSYL